jgi:tRNA(fMet)-specific endonuclease VapC
MSLYVLDTDILSLLQRGDPVLEAAVKAHDPDDLAVTIISVEEQLSGWYSKLRQGGIAKNPKRLNDRARIGS